MQDVKKLIEKNPGRQIGSAVENMLKTGRLVTQTGLDLQQVYTGGQMDVLVSYACA